MKRRLTGQKLDILSLLKQSQIFSKLSFNLHNYKRLNCINKNNNIATVNSVPLWKQMIG